MQSRPLVSVVLPTYNRPEYLRIALESVLQQTYTEIEILVQDNASPQDPSATIAGFGDPRIKLQRNATNIGLLGNFLAGYARASGKYVTSISDDDRWHPGFVAAMVEPMERDPDLVLAFCDHDVIDADGRVDEAETEATTRRWGRSRLTEGRHCPFDDIALVYRSICTASGALLRRDAIDFSAIPAEIGPTVDLYLAYLAARTGRGCYYVPQRLIQYRVHHGSTTTGSRQIDRRIEFAEHAVFYWNRILNDRSLRRNRGYYLMKRGFNALQIVRGQLRKGDWRKGLGEATRFVRRGYIRPSIFLHYLRYALRLRRATA